LHQVDRRVVVVGVLAAVVLLAAVTSVVPVEARNWTVTVRVSRLMVKKAVDPWPADKHAEIYYYARIIAHAGGFIQWDKYERTTSRTVEIGKTYDGGRFSFSNVPDTYRISIRVEVWDDDNPIGMPYDDFLGGYPEGGANLRDAVWVWDVAYLEIFPGVSTTFTIDNDKVFARMELSWV